MTAEQKAEAKNIIAGLWHRHGDPQPMRLAPTLFDRCAALHAKMDAVLAMTLGVGHVPNEPRR